MKVEAAGAAGRTCPVLRSGALHPIGEVFPLLEACRRAAQRRNGVLSMTRKYWQSALPGLRNSCVVVAWK